MRSRNLVTAISAVLPIAVLSLAAQTAGAPKPVQVITPVFHQLVAYSIPARFNFASPDHANQNFYIHEMVPRGQTVEQWTEMVTLTGTRGAASKTAAGSIETAAAGFKQACPETFAYKPIGTMQISNSPAALAIISCGRVADEHGKPGAMHSETALYVAIAGDQDLYTIQWAERGPASAKPLQLDDRKWSARARELGPIRVCPKIDGEKAPYPSCLS